MPSTDVDVVVDGAVDVSATVVVDLPVLGSDTLLPHLRLSSADAFAMLSFQRLDGYRRSIQFLAFGSECAASLDVPKVRCLIGQARYEPGSNCWKRSCDVDQDDTVESST